MNRHRVACLLLGAALCTPAAAQLQYFGYVGAADDDLSLNKTKGFTNFAHVVASEHLTDVHVSNRVEAISQAGLKATIDLGRVLWCDEANQFRWLCGDWEQRWSSWKAFNAGVLVPGKVLAFQIRDEPFNYNVYMAHYELAAARVKQDLPWAKLLLTEAACVVAWDDCGWFPGSSALNNYQGTLPNVDWIGVHAYGIRPATDSTLRVARQTLGFRFPDKKWLYVMDGFYDPSRPYTVEFMGQIAREWYDVARADPKAVLLGVFLWGDLVDVAGAIGSKDFPCSALEQHVLIGRTITGKSRINTSPPIGRLESIANGTGLVTGWACDPDATLCEDPRYVDLQLYGGNYTTAWFYSPYDYVLNPQCGIGIAYRFRQGLTGGSSGLPVTAFARDIDGSGTTLPSNCPDNPACIWYSTVHQPKGYMDGISPAGIATGWVCDPDAPTASSSARLRLGDGTTIGIYTANQPSEQAVADECYGGNLHRFSAQLPAWTRGQPIYAYAIDLVSGTEPIPWICPKTSYCIWY